MTWTSKFSFTNHEIDLLLNQANVALTRGNFDVAAEQASIVLNSSRVSKLSKLTAEFILIQTRSRQGLFAGVLDELELIFRRVPKHDNTLEARIGNEIIWVCYRSGNLGIGAARGEELLRNNSSTWLESDVVQLLCQLSSCHFHRGDTARAEEVVSRAVSIAESAGSAKSRTHSLWQSSILASIRGESSLALQLVNEAKQWAQKSGLQNAMPALNHNAALIMLELPNADLSFVNKLAESAYLEATTQNNPSGASYACEILSEVALRREDLELALMYAKKGLMEMPIEIPGPKTSLLVQIAKVLARMGKFKESETELSVATEHMRQEEPSRELAKQWGDIARVFVEVGLADRGVYAYEKAIQMSGLLREEQDSFVN